MAIGTQHVALACAGPEVDAAPLFLLCQQHPVEAGRPLRSHLGPELVSNIYLGLRAEFQRHQFAGAMADAVGDIIAGDVEHLA